MDKKGLASTAMSTLEGIANLGPGSVRASILVKELDKVRAEGSVQLLMKALKADPPKLGKRFTASARCGYFKATEASGLVLAIRVDYNGEVIFPRGLNDDEVLWLFSKFHDGEFRWNDNHLLEFLHPRAGGCDKAEALALLGPLLDRLRAGTSLFHQILTEAGLEAQSLYYDVKVEGKKLVLAIPAVYDLGSDEWGEGKRRKGDWALARWQSDRDLILEHFTKWFQKGMSTEKALRQWLRHWLETRRKDGSDLPLRAVEGDTYDVFEDLAKYILANGDEGIDTLISILEV